LDIEYLHSAEINISLYGSCLDVGDRLRGGQGGFWQNADLPGRAGLKAPLQRLG